MIKWITIVMGVTCATAYAQPNPDQPDKPDNKTSEKAGSNESLQNGAAGVRPWAQGVAPAEQSAALKLFHDGNVQLNDGLFAKAAENYKNALKHWDHPAIHYNLALAEMNLDQPIEAYDNLQASLKYGEAPLQSKDKFDHAKDYMLLLSKQIAEVEVSCDKPGAKVSVDGQIAFTAPGSYKSKVRAGKHSFLAEKEGYTTRVTAPYISAGAPFRIDLKLYTAEELTRYHRKWQATWMPYTVMGAGALIGGISALVALSATNSYADYDRKVAACSMPSGAGNSGCDATADITALKDSGDSKMHLAYVGYGIAGAAFITGAVLAYINRPEAYQIRAEDLQNEQQVTVAPIVSPTMTGAAVQGHF